ncbi:MULTISPECIES: dihydropteroate synthase [Acidobacteriaceae]|uniref:dihydropteroate synthase n=1 Tax=Acidobacteriaceae TaxID=204434 RepID=UPI0020B12FA3|nr:MULTISPECIES: dihydropteroate synthase [Acidobacteriaceae]MDW5267601.1 dihydropteroate synthase [Edaphobacter sp.]
MPLTARPRFDWSLRSRTLALGQHTLVMGILNVTPDSFSDGGHFYSPEHAPERALAQAHQMLDDGAHILDIGGESTRPNAILLSADEEQARILPVIEAILAQRPDTILSIDTHHASTAVCAVEAGVEIVNDVSGHLWDATMTMTCIQLGCGTVLMHTRGRPHDWLDQPPIAAEEVVPLVLHGLKERIDAATSAGIALNRIVLDPGFGFGKRLDENYPLLAHLDRLQQLNLPILAGVSRKSFLAQALAPLYEETLPPPEARLHATTAANVTAILNGAHMIRTHDVLPAVEAAAIADRILAAV